MYTFKTCMIHESDFVNGKALCFCILLCIAEMVFSIMLHLMTLTLLSAYCVLLFLLVCLA